MDQVIIHPTAIVAAGAEIGAGSAIGPYSVIGPKVRIGRNNQIGPHVVIEGNTLIGDENRIYQFASVGSHPQDLKYRGEDSQLRIGNKNLIREFTTLQPGTAGGGMLTSIADQNLFMANTHVGHDSHVGSYNVFANSSALSGHVTIGNRVIVGGLSGIHQFVRVGDMALIGGGSMVTKDVPPYCTAQGDRAFLIGLNQVGMQRNGLAKSDIAALRKVFRAVFYGSGQFKERVDRVAAEFAALQAATPFFDFLRSSERGICSLRRALRNVDEGRSDDSE